MSHELWESESHRSRWFVNFVWIDSAVKAYVTLLKRWRDSPEWKKAEFESEDTNWPDLADTSLAHTILMRQALEYAFRFNAPNWCDEERETVLSAFDQNCMDGKINGMSGQSSFEGTLVSTGPFFSKKED